MDFARYNAAKSAESGSWMHIEDPITREPLYAIEAKRDAPELGVEKGWNALSLSDAAKLLGKEPPKDRPCRIRVQGIQSPQLRRMHRDHERSMTVLHQRAAGLAHHAKAAAVEQINEETDRFGLAVFAAAITEWENIPWDGEILPVSDDNKSKLIPRPGQLDAPTEWLMKQVGSFMREETNFLGRSANS